MRYSVNLVACPRKTGKTPLAKGSSVPPCPTLDSPTSFLTRATTEKEEWPLRLMYVEDTIHVHLNPKFQYLNSK